MVSNLDFRFDAHDTASRAKARKKYLRTALDRLRRVRKIFADQGADDVFLDLLLLQSALQQFMQFKRGYPLLDADMAPHTIGPLGDCLRAFNDVIKGSTLRDFETALTECEAKIETELRSMKDAEHVTA